ncbi:Z1 domain-containing protein [Porphyromonas gulae]|uniref:Z1 domain-containing protein n=1 Tax=Porphyromonas gulae TaxID=111105 RepID=UPI00068B43A0|nr:Z1 domain-containing protein [Porphyromonas gulae]
MGYLDKYTKLLDDDWALSVRETSGAILRNINSRSPYEEDLMGLLLGHVQSGKTGQMIGVIASLADEGYKVFLLLTTDNVDLQRQTYNRVKETLHEFHVLSENEGQYFNPNNLIKPVVIILKKNPSILRKWSNLLVSSNLAKGLCLCIFDDEGDAASLNTLVNRGKESTINQYLRKIRKSATSSIYLEVTATPQSLILQSIISNWKPSFVNYFKPGKGYLGGNFFYSNPKSFCIRFTAENELDEVNEENDSFCPEGLQMSIMSYLVCCAYKRLNGESNCNFMIHPSVRIDVHRKFENRVQEHLTLLQQSTEDEGFQTQLYEAWSDLQRTKPDLPHYEEIKKCIVEILDSTLIYVISLNSHSLANRDPNNPDSLNLNVGFNIIIGGNTLGRGLTFPNLQTVYYCRSSKSPQADTHWQHSRIFGYDRIKELVRIFIPRSLHSLFVLLNESNNMLISQVEKNFNHLELIYPNGIKPTRTNVIDKQYLNLIVGGVNTFASHPIEANTSIVDRLIDSYSRMDSVVCPAEILIDLLHYVGDADIAIFNSGKFVNCIRALKGKRPSIICRLIVRTNRDIAKGTGSLLSPNDRKLGELYKDDIVLTMYRIIGSKEKGWNGNPIWIPNIRFPNGVCFYSTDDSLLECTKDLNFSL